MSDFYIPSVDGCCFCGDCECDGIGCIARLDPDDERDHSEIERLHALLRAGAAFLGASDMLADAENRQRLDGSWFGERDDGSGVSR